MESADGTEIDTFVPLYAAQIMVVDLLAKTYTTDGCRWSYFNGCDDLFEYAFWERLYGPYGAGDEDCGMLPWDDYVDC